MGSIATVVKHTGSHYLLTELPCWNPFPAVLRGKVRLNGSKTTNPIAVGDLVEYESGEPTAVISKILDRKNYIIRKSTNLSRQSHVIAANVDQAVIITTLYFPELKLPFLDRILLTCEVYGIKPVIVLNKVDIYREHAQDEVQAFRAIYEGAGYKVIETSTKTGEGVETLREECKDKLSLFSGESGVGKSSMIKALDPALEPRTGEISDVHLQGKHTTTFYEMYRFDHLGASGCIIDTPGIRGFGLVDLKKDEIGLYFPEMLALSRQCRFTPCTHTHEPGCAVKAALEDGSLSQERYNSYLGMLDDATEGKYR